nr:DUF2537 domain-containing protein [Saccharopolyspora sp. HNM0983]
MQVRDGRPVLAQPGAVELDIAAVGLSADLVDALHEWAEVCGSLSADGAAQRGEAVSRRGRRLAARMAAETGAEIVYRDPVRGHPIRLGGGARTAEPVPWGSGLLVSGIIAALVAVTLVVMTLGLAEVSPVLSVLVNLAVAAGLAPSVWIGRRTPVWRWVAFGTGAGICAAWCALLLGLLG